MPYVAVTRGPLVESVHAVAACAARDDGTVALALGAVDAPVFLRSTAKPFIAAEIVRSGTAQRFGFDGRELAIIAASHGGEPFHVAAVSGILAKIGLGPEALQCGAHPPSYEPAAAALAAAGVAPSALHNNCSGKHAGILAMCVHLGADPATYLDAAHPVQRRSWAFARGFVTSRSRRCCWRRTAAASQSSRHRCATRHARSPGSRPLESWPTRTRKRWRPCVTR